MCWCWFVFQVHFFSPASWLFWFTPSSFFRRPGNASTRMMTCILVPPRQVAFVYKRVLMARAIREFRLGTAENVLRST
ncbi:hypothetical protein LZ30DRAFT_742331 [Colletotrichum cereale]|nr:hypothetical protein LZ30DRAFT_742331 [Colletotrichum cereale]